jgi:hypothetical protein
MWQGVVGMVVWFSMGISYYFFYSRHRLTMSPEERLGKLATTFASIHFTH